MVGENTKYKFKNFIRDSFKGELPDSFKQNLIDGTKQAWKFGKIK